LAAADVSGDGLDDLPRADLHRLAGAAGVDGTFALSAAS
jgi:hypothetical protein